MRRTVETSLPVDLQLSLGPLAHGKRAHRVDGGIVWRATRTPEGAATLKLSGGDHVVEMEAWGPGARWALEHGPELVGSGDHIDGFEPDGLVGRLHRRMPGMRFGKTRSVFEPMLSAIIGQKVPGKAAGRSYARLLAKYGEQAPGPVDLKLQPEPAVLAGLPYEAFHPLGIERKRADTIRRTAARSGRVEEAAAMAPMEATTRLIAFPGIGAWTASQVVQVALGDADAVVTGDYNLPHLVSWNLAGEPRGTDGRMLELLEPYRGHRARVVRLLKAGGETPPRYGPKLEIRQIEKT